MNKDQKLIAEAYSRIYIKEGTDSPLAKAARVAAEEFDSGESYLEIIDGVAEQYDVDPIDLARELHSVGVIGEEELNSFIEYVNKTPAGNNSAEHSMSSECHCPACTGERLRRSNYIQDHGGDSLN